MRQTFGICLGGLVLASCFLPILSEAATAPAGAATGDPGGAAETPYVVKRGDTLWGIRR